MRLKQIFICTMICLFSMTTYATGLDTLDRIVIAESEKDTKDKNERVEKVKIVSEDGIITLKVGEKHNLKVLVEPATRTNKSMRYKIQDKAVATIESNGEITAIAEGTTYATATSVTAQSKNDTVEIRVIAPEIPFTLPVGKNTIWEKYPLEIQKGVQDQQITIGRTTIAARVEGVDTATLAYPTEDFDKTITFREAFIYLNQRAMKAKELIARQTRKKIEKDLTFNGFNPLDEAYYHMGSILTKVKLATARSIVVKGPEILDQSVTRSDLAVILYGLTYDLDTDIFQRKIVYSDLEHVEDYVYYCTLFELMSGDNLNRFNPNKQVTRRDLLTVLSRLETLLETYQYKGSN